MVCVTRCFVIISDIRLHCVRDPGYSSIRHFSRRGEFVSFSNLVEFGGDELGFESAFTKS